MVIKVLTFLILFLLIFVLSFMNSDLLGRFLIKVDLFLILYLLMFMLVNKDLMGVMSIILSFLFLFKVSGLAVILFIKVD